VPRRPVVVGHPEQHAQPVADAADHLVVDGDAGAGDALDDDSYPPLLPVAVAPGLERKDVDVLVAAEVGEDSASPLRR
jgi:hypothetical protein